MGQPETIDDLKPWERNPRKISRKASKGLSTSLDRFGDIAGITYNERTGRLVCGHQRVALLRKAGGQLKDGTIVMPDGDRYPVRVVDWDEGKEAAANVAANNPFIGGEFDDGLDELLRELEDNLGALEFDALGFDALLKECSSPEDVEVEEDEAPEPPKDPVTREGDVWALGRHKLICGDCRTITGLSYGMMFTSPPYNAATHLDYGKGKNRPLYRDYNDDMTEDEWASMVADVVSSAKVAGAMWSFVNLSYSANARSSWVTFLGKVKQYLWETIIWDKKTSMPVSSGMTRVAELIFALKLDPSAGHLSAEFETEANIWRIPSAGSQSDIHSAAFPVALPFRAMGLAPRLSVCDPFMGTGTTLIAAEQLGRDCIGVELQPAYCDVIVERWENLTGGKATRKC